MNIIRDSGQIKVQSPYSPEFIKKAKELAGKWSKPYWIFDEKVAERLNEVLIEIYGEGFEEVKRADIEINLDIYDNDGEDQLMFRNLILATRFSRDSAVKVSENVYVKSGGFLSRGGSAKYPEVTWEDGTILVASVPITLIDNLPEGVSVVDKALKAKLEEEKEELLKRISEIDKQLASL